MNDLRQAYEVEGVEMSYTKEDYIREVESEYAKDPERHRQIQEMIRKGAKARDVLVALSHPEWIAEASLRSLLSSLSPQDRPFITKEILQEFSPEEIESYLNTLRQRSPDADTPSEN